MAKDEYYKTCNNCSDNNQYLKEDETQCSEDTTGYYLGDNPNEVLHGYIKKCYSSCKTCRIGGEIKNQNCDSCNDGMKLNRKNNCIIECYNQYY